MQLKRIIVTVAATASLLAGWSVASAAPYVLVAFHQRSSSGTLSSLFFKSGASQGCPGPTYTQPCYNPANTWVSSNGIATAVAASPPVFDWNGTTLTMTSGLLWASSFISSNANAPSVISDRITSLTITPGTATTTAATYSCVEGQFLATVNAHGCANLDLGPNFTYNSSVVYNVGGSASCVNRTIGGDDVSTGPPRGPINFVGGGGCDATDGGLDLHTIVPNPRFLVLANQANIVGSDGCYMFGRQSTKSASPCATDAAVAGASYMVFAPNIDTDGDGVIDALDNCRTISNATQVDSNDEGFGNRCDGDLNNNGATNSQDYILFRNQLGQPSTPPTYNAADINSNGAVNSQDYILFRGLLGSPPGPTGLCTAAGSCPAHP